MKGIEATVEIPQEAYETLCARGFSRERLIRDLRTALALKYYKDRVLSLGKAVELSGLSYWDFTEFLSQNGVAVVAHDEVNLKREFEAAQQLSRELKEDNPNEGCM